MGSCYPSRISWTWNQHIYNCTGTGNYWSSPRWSDSLHLSIHLRGGRNPLFNPLPFLASSLIKEPADGLRMRVSGFPTNQCEIEYSQNGVRDETSASFSEFSYWSKQNLRLFCSAKTWGRKSPYVEFCLFVFFLQKKLKVPLRYPTDQVARYVIITTTTSTLLYWTVTSIWGI